MMTTIEETKTSLNYIEIAGESLLELLEGASTHADKGKSALHALNTVQLEGAGGDLIARATDRYRLIEGAVRYSDGGLEPSLIALDDIKRTITLVKAHKLHLVNIHRVGDAMTISSAGDSVTFTLVEANYPPTAHLFAQFDNPSPSDIGAIDIVSFNPSFFADYAKIVGKGNPVTITFIAKNKPMLIGLGGDKVEWRALLMPMTIKK
jgi:DNA polymerase III sliding clamp (beta) subunit (PCNA family)